MGMVGWGYPPPRGPTMWLHIKTECHTMARNKCIETMEGQSESLVTEPAENPVPEPADKQVTHRPLYVWAYCCQMYASVPNVARHQCQPPVCRNPSIIPL